MSEQDHGSPELLALLAEQQRYYCARAPEYDEWWLRRGRYDLGEEGNRVWWAEVAEAQALLDEVPLEGRVLELAGGTGCWTEQLARRAARVTVLDGSAEMLALNERRLAAAGLRARVSYQKLDLFGWSPPEEAAGSAYDAVFFAFWLSHVPAGLVDGFLTKVARALRPGGSVAVLDNRPGSVDRSRHGTRRIDRDRERRQLKDGRRFSIVKRCDSPAEIEARLERAGIRASARLTATHFLVVTGQRR